MKILLYEDKIARGHKVSRGKKLHQGSTLHELHFRTRVKKKRKYIKQKKKLLTEVKG